MGAVVTAGGPLRRRWPGAAIGEVSEIVLRASWNDTVLAEAPRTVRLEGNHYFPPGSVNQKLLVKSKTKTLCPWKGIASFYHLKLDGATITDAAWYYPHPSPLAWRIKNHVAFDARVRVSGEREPQPPTQGGVRGVVGRLLGRGAT